MTKKTLSLKAEAKQWLLISQYEKSLDQYRQIIGDEEWDRMQKELLKFTNKRAQKIVDILSAKYEETKDKNLLVALKGLGVDVDL